MLGKASLLAKLNAHSLFFFSGVPQLLPTGTKVLRIMPNLPCVVQSGAIVLARGTCAEEEDVALLKRLLSHSGLCEEGPESYIDIHTGLSGSGVAYVSYLFCWVCKWPLQ